MSEESKTAVAHNRLPVDLPGLVQLDEDMTTHFDTETELQSRVFDLQYKAWFFKYIAQTIEGEINTARVSGCKRDEWRLRRLFDHAWDLAHAYDEGVLLITLEVKYMKLCEKF